MIRLIAWIVSHVILAIVKLPIYIMIGIINGLCPDVSVGIRQYYEDWKNRMAHLHDHTD